VANLLLIYICTFDLIEKKANAYIKQILSLGNDTYGTRKFLDHSASTLFWFILFTPTR